MNAQSYGVLAEFDSPEALMDAVRKARDGGYTRVEAYSPFPIHGLDDALGFADGRISWIVFFGGLVGAILGFGLQYYIAVIAYPQNIGGRPDLSWPSWIPVTFECTVLLASFSAIIGMLVLNGLPRPYHPLFSVERFDHASQDSFFMCIESTDPKYEADQTEEFVRGLRPSFITKVEE